MERFKSGFDMSKTATPNRVAKLINGLSRMRLGKVLAAIGGSEKYFSLEHRIFNLSSFFITTFAFLGGIANYMVGLIAPVVWLSFLGSAVSFIIYYFARYYRWFNVYVSFSYIVSTIAILSVMNFYN